ncbi:MAG: PAS domain S-box protein, partial [Candidatus Hydrogenedentota bacterium]
MNLDHIRKIFYLNEKSFRLETRKRSVHFSARLWIPVFVAIALVLVALAKPLGITETQALSLLATMNVILILVSGGFLHMLNKRRMAESHEPAGPREERKLMTRLEELGERYRTLADNLLTPVIIFQGSRIKFANRLFYSLSGYTPEEVINKDFDVFSVVH